MSYTEFSTPNYDNRLEGVIVCLDYSDFLNETISYNIPHFDRLVVVSSHDDRRTREVCNKWSVEFVPTDVLKENGSKFEKGAGINVGMSYLRQRGWFLQLDADIVLPLTFRNMLFKSDLRTDCIYGADRVNVVGYENWLKLKHKFHSEPQFSYNCLVGTSEEYPVGSRVIHKNFGYTPIGCFQLQHFQFIHQHSLRYPDTLGSAELSDVRWSIFWKRENRRLLSTLRVFHLESERANQGANWYGRTTQAFGPPIPVPEPGPGRDPARDYGYGYGRI